MSLTAKYQSLIDAVKSQGEGQPTITEQDGVLYIDGTVGSEQQKDNIWNIYNQIDPDYRSGDVRLNLVVSGDSAAQQYEVKPGDNLSKIGAKYGVSWKAIYEANKHIIKNPDLIQPGWKLTIPAK